MLSKRIICLVALLALLVATAGCQNRYGPKETGGAVIGGIGGAVLGSQIGSGRGQLVATAAGALLGAWLGREIGASLDRADQLTAAQTEQIALERNPDGQPATWRNPNTGASGYTTPVRTYETASGYCREFQTAVVIEGRSETATGTACRQPDGSWRIVS